METNPNGAGRRSPPALSAIGIEQLSYLRACISNGVVPAVLWASAALPILPFIFLNRGYPFSRGYAAVVLLLMCCALPVVLWQHRPAKGKGGDAYFLSLPVERRWHAAARAAAGWPSLMAAGVVLLTLAFAGSGADGVPAHGWLAPLLGMTALYLITSGLAVRTSQPGLLICGLMFLAGMTMRLGPEADESILPFLESLVIAFMGSNVSMGSGEGSEIIGSIGMGRWLLVSGAALALGLVVFLTGVMRDHVKWIEGSSRYR